MPNARYDSIAKVVTFHETLEQRLGALPGVVAVASAYAPPLTPGINGKVLIEGRPRREPGTETLASMHSITPAYFEMMRQPLIRGRGIQASDRTGTVPVAVVSQMFVDENFPNEDPIGKRFNVVGVDFGYGERTWTIVGVAGDVHRSLTIPPRADVYVPLEQFGAGPGGLTVFMRTAAGMTPTAATIREVLHAIDPGLPVVDYETVDAVIRASVAPRRFYLLAMGIFADAFRERCRFSRCLNHEGEVVGGKLTVRKVVCPDTILGGGQVVILDSERRVGARRNTACLALPFLPPGNVPYCQTPAAPAADSPFAGFAPRAHATTRPRP